MIRRPAGSTLLPSARLDRSVRWAVAGPGTAGAVLDGHTGEVRAVCAFTGSDGRPLLATGGPDGTVRVWDPASATTAPVLSPHAGPWRAPGAVPASAGPPQPPTRPRPPTPPAAPPPPPPTAPPLPPP